MVVYRLCDKEEFDFDYYPQITEVLENLNCIYEANEKIEGNTNNEKEDYER